jgi:hypothetical protein
MVEMDLGYFFDAMRSVLSGDFWRSTELTCFTAPWTPR